MLSDNDPIPPERLEALFEPLSPGLVKPCALAVSGGSDSTALMVLLADWLRQRHLHTGLHTVVTVDHGFRPQSAGEARAVAAQSATLGFHHVTLAWQGSKPRTGVQAAARQARYRLIGEYMRAKSIGLLLTAHTRDDLAETLLMRLARGSGLDGLASMAPRLLLSDLGFADSVASFQPEIARPLLDMPKAQLRATLQARGVTWIEDPGNQSPAFERSRFRAARAELDALGLTHAMLALSATRLLRARRAIEQGVSRFLDSASETISVNPCGCFVVDLAGLQAAEAEIALRVLGRVIAAAGGSDGPVPLGKLETIAEALRHADAGPAKWTLARALITATGRTVTIEREPGREPLPRFLLAAGERARWDGRFWVRLGPEYASGTVEVRALGEVGLNQLRQLCVLPSRVASAVLVPSFWREGTLLAAPCLDYWLSPEIRATLHADFIWSSDAQNKFAGL